jgi:hypothetical protein
LALPNNALIRLLIYDISGRLVEKLVDGRVSAGSYEIFWAPNGGSGVYFYILESPWRRAVGKIVLLK